MPFATADGNVRLHFETIGSGEPILLVSGQASDRHVWDAVRDDFASHHQVIVFDHRGTGESDRPQQPAYTTRAFARDAVAVLDHLGIRRAHAYGISMGGRVCQWLGIDHAERIGALVLGATTPGNARGVRRSPDVDAVLRGSDSAASLTLEVSPRWMANHPEFMARMAGIERHRVAPIARDLHYRASEAHEAWDLLPAIAAPTLVIHGSDDRVNPTANAYLLKERIPAAELYIVQGGRHGFFEEFREEASRVVLDFLRRHPLKG